MNCILIEGHEVKHDLRELLRIVFDGKDYEFIGGLDEYKESGRLIKSSKIRKGKKEYIRTSLIRDGNLLGESEEAIDDVNVFMGSYDKKLNVAVKKSLLKATGLDGKLPWGVLTGIRPMKIVHNLKDKLIADEDISLIFKDEYLVDEDKIDLLLEIGGKQRKYLEEGKGKYSIYISIPFCPTRCLYCSFPSLNIDRYEDEIGSYVETLIYEMDEVFKILDPRKLNTVYIGGGTPTSIDIEYLSLIIDKVYEYFGNDILEFTIEAGRPDTLDRSYLEMMKEKNIDRISINPQTMRDETLKVIGRNHKTKDIVDIYELAEDVGIASINMDMIIGLPGEGLEDNLYTLDKLMDLGAENITVHTLAVKRASRFKKTMDEYELNERKKMIDIMNRIHGRLMENGYHPYYLYRQKYSIGNLENIGYAKDGYDCIYNISMMEERESIIAFGFGGISKILGDNGRIERVPNFKGYHDYMGRIDELIGDKKKALENN